MLAISESLRDRETTLAASHRCSPGIHGDRCATSLFHFVAQYPQELPPGSIADTLGQAVVLHHAPDIQVFVGNKVILLSQLSRCLMFKIKSLPLNLQMCLSYQEPSLPSSVRAFDPGRKPSLPSGQQLLTLPKPAGVVYHRAIGEHGKGFEANINAYRIAGVFLLRRFPNVTGEDSEPPVTLSFDTYRLDLAFDWPMQVDPDSADILDIQFICQLHPIAIGRESEGVKPVSSFEAGISWLLSRLDSAEEGFEGLVQPSKNILSSRVVKFSAPGVLHSDIFELVSLVVIVERDSTLPSITPLLESSVVEEPGDIQQPTKGLILSPVGIQPIDERFAHLFTLLSLDIFPDCIFTNVAHCSSVVAPGPEAGKFRAEFPELSSQYSRGVALELVHDVLNCLSRLTSDKYVNVVWVNLHYLNLNAHLLSPKVKQLAQTLSDLRSKHLFPILRTPDQVILDVVDTTSVSLISVAHNQYYTTAKRLCQALFRKEVCRNSSVT
jgi:hypothetical protein